MATDPFSAAFDESAGQGLNAGRKRSKFALSAAQVITGLCVVATVTFGVAFHLPLKKAHALLFAEHTSLQEEKNSADKSLKETQEQLLAAQEERDELAAAKKKASDEKAAGYEQALDLNTQVSEKLAAFTKKALLSVGKDGSHTLLTVDDRRLFSPNELGLTRTGKRTVCGIGKSLKALASSTKVVIEGHVTSKKVPSTLRKTHPTSWDVSSAHAASVLAMLQACGFSTSKTMSVAGFGHLDPNESAPKGSLGEIRLRISPLPTK